MDTFDSRDTKTNKIANVVDEKKRDKKANQKLADTLAQAPLYNFAGSPLVKLLAEIEEKDKLTSQFVDTFITMCMAKREKIDYRDIYSISKISKIFENLTECPIEYYLIPIHDGDAKHWTLCLIQKSSKKIFHFDSLSLQTSRDLVKGKVGKHQRRLTILKNYPQQGNTFDGGVFMLCMYYHVSNAENVPEILSESYEFPKQDFCRDFLKKVINQKLNDKIISHYLGVEIGLLRTNAPYLSLQAEKVEELPAETPEIQQQITGQKRHEKEEHKEDQCDVKSKESEPAPSPRVIAKKQSHASNGEDFYYNPSTEKKEEKQIKEGKEHLLKETQIEVQPQSESSSEDEWVGATSKAPQKNCSISALKEKVINSQAAPSTQKATPRTGVFTKTSLNVIDETPEIKDENRNESSPVNGKKWKVSQKLLTPMKPMHKTPERSPITRNSDRKRRAKYKGRKAYCKKRVIETSYDQE